MVSRDGSFIAIDREGPSDNANLRAFQARPLNDFLLSVDSEEPESDASFFASISVMKRIGDCLTRYQAYAF